MGHWGPRGRLSGRESGGTFHQCGLYICVCLCTNPYQLWVFINVLFLGLGVCAGKDGILSLWGPGSPPQLEQQVPGDLLGRGQWQAGEFPRHCHWAPGSDSCSLSLSPMCVC